MPKRQKIISRNHNRLRMGWQFFFTGWGLIMIAALVAGALMTRQLLWTPISAFNMNDILNNNFRMVDAVFNGVDKNGNPYSINAKTARQERGNSDMVYFDTVSGTVVRITDGKKITDKINAKSGIYDTKKRSMTLMGDVRVDSDNGDKVRTQELLIWL